MKAIAVCTLGLALTGLAIAGSNSKEEVRHIITLNGLNQGDGRYIRTDIIENGEYKTGYYFCGTRHSIVYGDIVYAEEVSDSYHVERSIKFSICQDETLTQCQEFAWDQFTIFKNEDGYLETDSRPVLPINIASVKDAFKSCTPNPDTIDPIKKLTRDGRHKGQVS